MNRGDIKLMIERMRALHIAGSDVLINSAAHVNAEIADAVVLLETLGNKVAQQAAVIEKISEKLKPYPKLAHNTGYFHLQEFFEEILATPTDSKQILNDWMREQLGEPVGVFYRGHGGEGWRESHDPEFKVNHTPLFKLPNGLK